MEKQDDQANSIRAMERKMVSRGRIVVHQSYRGVKGMMRYILPILIAMMGNACAQAYIGAPPLQWCYDGVYFAARPDGTCYAEDKGKTPVFALTTEKILPAIGRDGISITISSVSRSCPADRSLVMIDASAYKCAKDLTDPE